MPLEVDYLPIAAASGANVDSQSDFSGSGYQVNGFISGLAQSKQFNKALRQSSMIAAALANVIAVALNSNVLDDGNLPNLISLLTKALTRHYSDTTQNVLTAAGTLNSVALPAAASEVGSHIRVLSFVSESTGGPTTFSLELNATILGTFSFTASSGAANGCVVADLLIIPGNLAALSALYMLGDFGASAAIVFASSGGQSQNVAFNPANANTFSFVLGGTGPESTGNGMSVKVDY